jgi:hypothetical protein
MDKKDDAISILEQFLSSTYDADEYWVPRRKAQDLLNEINQVAASQ